MTEITHWYRKLFGDSRPLIGMLHLPPLPGSPRSSSTMKAIAQRAVHDAKCYMREGFHGLLIENFGDTPFPSRESEPHVISAMTRISCEVKSAFPNAPIGVNVLRNDGLGAIGVACGADLDFVRINILTGVAVTDQGIIEGDAANVLRYRRTVGNKIRILADFRVKHASPMRVASAEIEVHELLERGLADGLLVTGAGTGHPPSPDSLAEVKHLSGAAPTLVASGTTATNIGELAKNADGFIVGSSVKIRGLAENAVSPGRVASLVRAHSSLTVKR